LRYYEPRIGLNYDQIKKFDYMDDRIMKNRNIMIKKLIVSKKEVDYFE